MSSLLFFPPYIISSRVHHWAIIATFGNEFYISLFTYAIFIKFSVARALSISGCRECDAFSRRRAPLCIYIRSFRVPRSELALASYSVSGHVLDESWRPSRVASQAARSLSSPRPRMHQRALRCAKYGARVVNAAKWAVPKAPTAYNLRRRI